MNVALRPDSLNLISLCTGGGGLDLGVELAIPSARSVVLVEREAFACSHLVSAMQQGLMAEAALWSDVTTFNGRPWRGIVDGLIGGIPCQPHSLAGKRLGEDDERDLWSDARRIIVQSGAWFVLIENVRGMLSSGGAERVWRDLYRLGFTVEGGLFTASEVRASHERERIFILAVADHAMWRWHLPSTARKRGGPAGSSRGPRGELADASSERSASWISGSVGPDQEGNPGKPFDGGNAMVYASGIGRGKGWPQPELRSGRHSLARADYAMGDAIGCGHDGRPDDEVGRSIRRATAKGSGEQSLGDVGHTKSEGRRGLPVRSGRQDETGPYALRTSLFPPGPSDLRSWASILASAPELEPAFRRVADGLASRLDIARVDRLRMLGNGVVSLQAAYALRTLATRLAASGSAGAARLVRMMELGEMVSFTPQELGEG